MTPSLVVERKAATGVSDLDFATRPLMPAHPAALLRRVLLCKIDRSGDTGLRIGRD